MLKKHTYFILIFITLALGIHVKNLFFSTQKPNLIGAHIPSIQASNIQTLSVPKLVIGKMQKPAKENEILLNIPTRKQNESKEHIKINSNSAENTKALGEGQNKFSKTYQKFANLEFKKGLEKQYVIDFQDFKDEYLSLGFTVDEGEILSPKVSVKYSDGSTEDLKVPYNHMFVNDWIKLNLKPNLSIQSLTVSAVSPESKSIFSFFIQQNL